ncbi:hypothetical protein AHF37_01162 [Paragonimus kellicotti]|nr:hypothetical protein AHF37_01162 [Paragonimus kellicotti]
MNCPASHSHACVWLVLGDLFVSCIMNCFSSPTGLSSREAQKCNPISHDDCRTVHRREHRTVIAITV